MFKSWDKWVIGSVSRIWQPRICCCSFNQVPETRYHLSFYEYVYFGKPIVTIAAPDGELANLLLQRRLGQVFSDGEEAKLAQYLLDFENRWMYTVFLMGLVKYLVIKPRGERLDGTWQYAKRSLLHYATWMVENQLTVSLAMYPFFTYFEPGGIHEQEIAQEVHRG